MVADAGSLRPLRHVGDSSVSFVLGVELGMLVNADGLDTDALPATRGSVIWSTACFEDRLILGNPPRPRSRRPPRSPLAHCRDGSRWYQMLATIRPNS